MKKKVDLAPFHKAVCERDEYICQYCLKDFSASLYFDEKGVNQYVCGHHTASQGAHPGKRLDPSIGICVCFGCHELAHRGFSKEEIRTKKMKTSRQVSQKTKKGGGGGKLTHYYNKKTGRLEKY